MPRFTKDNTQGYTDAQLAFLNNQFEEEAYLPASALARMSDTEIKSWQDHMAERVLAEFDADQVLTEVSSTSDAEIVFVQIR